MLKVDYPVTTYMGKWEIAVYMAFAGDFFFHEMSWIRSGT